MLMAKSPVPDLSRTTRNAHRRILLLAFFLLLLYVIVPRLDNFSASLEAIKDARWELVALAFALVGLSFVAAAGVYQSLSYEKTLYLRRTLLVQVANAFANRLLPAGIGALTVGTQYLRKSGYTLPQAVAIVGTNNMIGLLGHMLLLGFAMVVGSGDLTGRLSAPDIPNGGLIAAAVALIAVVLLVAFRTLRQRLRKLTVGVGTYLVAYRRHPGRLVAALACSLGLTVCYLLTFYVSGLAVGMELPVEQAFVVFTVGMVATAVTPTPGGLGGAEAALVAGQVAYGVDAPVALAGVLLYRLLTYWLPLVPGFIAFMRIRGRYI